MFRAIREVKPRWVLAENVAGIINMELENVLADLEGACYETQAFVIPACAVGAPHRRDRVWIVACDIKNPIGERWRRGDNGNKNQRTREIQAKRSGASLCENIADSNSEHREESERGDKLGQTRGKGTSGWSFHKPNWEEDWLEAATRLCRVDDGVSHRVDRLRALGNAIVPQVAWAIFEAIKQYDRGQ
jgi:DNA (cytosine-5)-methyltransferase 1